MKNGVPKGAPFFTYSPQNEQNMPTVLNYFNNRQSKECNKFNPPLFKIQLIMKYLFNIPIIIAMLCAGALLASCSGDDEPSATKAPEIIDQVLDDVVTVKAVGDGEVKLYFEDDMEETANPTSFGRDFVDYYETMAATAKEPGKTISKTIVKKILIPKTDTPKIVDAYSVIESEEDSTFFDFHFNLYKGTGSIGVGKAVFGSGDDTYERNFRLDVQVTFDPATGIYSCRGTNITPIFKSSGKEVTYEGYTVNNLFCDVCVKDLTYSISFDCHGKYFDYNGSISKNYPLIYRTAGGQYVVVIIDF